MKYPLLIASCLIWSEFSAACAGSLDLGTQVQDGVREDMSKNRQNVREGLAPLGRALANTKNYDESLSCLSGDTCYAIVERRKQYVDLICIKGPYKGAEECVMVNSKGYWASGCGLTETFAYHYKSFKRAANVACGQ
jgi:hypothetical protein